MQHLRKVWEPNPGSQTLFLTCPIREAVLEGTRGGGKTDALLMDFAQHCGLGFGSDWRGILFRESYPQLADVVAKSKRWFYQIFPGIRFTDYTWRWPTGEELLFRHMNKPEDYWNYHGHEYPWIGWEELTNWSTLDCYESMLACNRSSNSRVPKKVRGTTNPYGKGHNAVKAYFIDPMPRGKVLVEEREIPQLDSAGNLVKAKVQMKRVAIHSSYLENPKLLVADPMYLANIEKLTDQNKRKAWLFGDWNVTSGGIFDDLWSEPIHVVKPFEIPTDWRIDRSLDWGTARPFSVGFWAESNGNPVLLEGKQRTIPRGTLIRIGEWYGCTGKPNEGLRITSTKCAQGVIAREKLLRIHGRCKAGPADSAIFDVVEDTSIASNFEDNKVIWLPADKKPGSRKNGVELFRARLESTANDDGKPGVLIFDRCRGWIRTVPPLPRDENDPDDVDTEAEDHAWDDTRYRLLGARPAKATVTSLHM